MQCGYDVCNNCIPIPQAASAPKAPLVKGKKYHMLDWDEQYCLFFTGNMVFYYDNAKDRVEEGGPYNIADEFPGVWTDGFDTVFKWADECVYFFKGDQYIRYNHREGCVPEGYPRHLSEWPGVTFDRIDAAVYYSNGKAYFFRAGNYIRYDMAADHADADYPMNTGKMWKGIWGEGIDSVGTWPRANGFMYFYKGNQYIKYDFNADKSLEGYPMVVSKGWGGIPDL